jgi:outer membrane receptor for ferric coprogen and ferric-rhodotorulic acid
MRDTYLKTVRRQPALGLLGTTALAALVLASGAARAQQNDAGAEVPLETIAVTEKRDPAATEGSTSYGTPAVTVGGKEATPIKEVPQSVSVVTRQRLDDQNLTSIEQAARYSTGLTVISGDPFRGSIFARGYELDTFLVDGLPRRYSSIFGGAPDLFIYDRIEFLRGPSGLFGGAGELGVTANLPRKRALPAFAAYASTSIGSYGYKRVEADLSGPLNAAGTVRGRLVGALHATDSFVDITDSQKGIGYGTLEFDLTDQTTLSVGGSHQRQDLTPFIGLPTYTNGAHPYLPRDTFVGARWNRFDALTSDAFAELHHRFEQGGFAKFTAQYVAREADFTYALGGTPVDLVTNRFTLNGTTRSYEDHGMVLDGHVSLPFELLGQTHNVLVGADMRRFTETDRSGTARIPGFQSVFAPNPNVAEPRIPFTAQTKQTPEQYGLYGQLKVKPLSRLTLIAGGRLSSYHNDVLNLATGRKSSVDVDGVFTPYGAAIVDLTDQISAYASYTTIFQPQTDRTISGDALDPREGHQIETGIKGSFFGGLLNTHVAVFRLEDENRSVADPFNTGFFVGTGKVRTQGLEAEISGTILPGWDVSAGYAYTETEYLQGPPSVQGTPFSSLTPEHTAYLWTRYTIQEGWARGLSLGGGVKASSEAFRTFGVVTVENDAYAVVSAQIGYEFNKNLSATLTVNNVFDTRYFTQPGTTTVFNQYGEPRSVIFKLAGKF